jgi:putative ABC transport system permease protein
LYKTVQKKSSIISPNKIISTFEFIKKTFKSFDPGLPIDFHFLDEDYDNLCLKEGRMGKIFGYFSLLAIIISCLGLV